MLTILHKYAGGPVGLNTIAASLSEEEDAIEEIYEPYLMQLGLLDRTQLRAWQLHWLTNILDWKFRAASSHYFSGCRHAHAYPFIFLSDQILATAPRKSSKRSRALLKKMCAS